MQPNRFQGCTSATMGGSGLSEAGQYDSYASLRLETIGVKASSNTSMSPPKAKPYATQLRNENYAARGFLQLLFWVWAAVHREGRNKKHTGCGKEAESQAQPQEPQPDLKPWFQDARQEAVMLSTAILLLPAAPCCPCISAVPIQQFVRHQCLCDMHVQYQFDLLRHLSVSPIHQTAEQMWQCLNRNCIKKSKLQQNSFFLERYAQVDLKFSACYFNLKDAT